MSNQQNDFDLDDGLAVEEDQPKLDEPKQYKVVLMNDDYTPMEFVVEVLNLFFGMDSDKATRVMMAVHPREKGSVAFLVMRSLRPRLIR